VKKGGIVISSTTKVLISILIGSIWFLVSDVLADHVAKDEQRREAYDKVKDVFKDFHFVRV
jgi:hypothetical protein